MQSIIQSVCHSDAVDNFFSRMAMELSSYMESTHKKNMSIYVGVNNAIFMAEKIFFDINWRKLTS